jgi:regulator of protease activity HflC (stomatin/prohibitin superfamily)
VGDKSIECRNQGRRSERNYGAWIARQAEAEREQRTKTIHAGGELQASEKLLQAAQMLAQAPQPTQLRYLQTLTAIAGDKTRPSFSLCRRISSV